jgi:RNA 3'-terminal phosphate cyclase
LAILIESAPRELGNQPIKHEILAQKLAEKMARKHQAEPHSADSTVAMAKLAGTATKFTQTLELSTNLQLLILRTIPPP